MATKHNPVTLPINLYAVGPPDVQPLDLTKFGDHHSVQHMPQKEVTEFLYTSSQIVCVKNDKNGPEITLILAFLQDNAKIGMKKRWPKVLFEIRLTQYVFWKFLRNTLSKRPLFVSQRPTSIIKMFWTFNRQVMSSLSQNQQKFLLMNMK